MTEEEKDLQGWLECQSTGIARQLKLAFDPELLAKKLVIQQQLINLAQEVQQHGNTNGTDVEDTQPHLDEDRTGGTGEQPGEPD